jgi:hypothetical protein
MESADAARSFVAGSRLAPDWGLARHSAVVAWLALASCNSPPPEIPAHPTWEDVEPILRAECLGCHGATAPSTGSARGVTYRLDFFDLTRTVCGEVASAVPEARFAAAASSQIAFDITSDNASVRPKMPPEPSPWLADWEWQTLLRWTHDPQKGQRPPGNRPPTITVTSPERTILGWFQLSIDLEDPDGDSAIGVLQIGDATLTMDRPGAFSIEVDGSQWPVGDVAVSATVCDGWSQATYDQNTLGTFQVLSLF